MDDKKIIEIEVRGKTFKIWFVSNWVVREYEKLNQKLATLQEMYKELETLPGKDRIQELAAEIKKIGSSLLDDRLEIVEEILLTNDIDFDRKWWERKTDAVDISTFLNKCAFKDVIASKKKVKAE